ncbi:kinase-like domain-containing protein [Melampsora americana]|nr:kinase-like domain-containing protein [Melampsora americana]
MSDGMGLVKAEVAIMKKLAHPNIASLIEVIDTDTDSLFFVLELCPYGSVMPIQIGQESLKLDLNESRNIFRQLILGIEYLHFNEILHRDIKPDNILFFENPKTCNEPLCKIVDFGVSETFGKDGDDTTQKLAGSPAFISPELCASTGGTRGKPADIWAMGVTLYTLVVGKLPFEDTNQLSLCEKIINDPVLIPDGTDPDLEDLLKKLLNKSPELRIEMKELKEHPWVTDHSKYPLPTTSENVTPINPPTELEIAYAFKSLRSLTTILKAVTRLKARSRSRRTLSQNDLNPPKEERGNDDEETKEEKEKAREAKEAIEKEICLSPNPLRIELDELDMMRMRSERRKSSDLISSDDHQSIEESFKNSMNLNQ